MANAKLWLVYSREHNAFWKPNECGYTTLVTEAGRYSHERALEICCGANYGLPVRESHEVPVVAPEAVGIMCSLLEAAKRMIRDQKRPVFSMDFAGSVKALEDAVAKAESEGA